MDRRQVLGSLGIASLAGCLRLSNSSDETTTGTEKGLQDQETERTATSAAEDRETTEATTERDEEVGYPTGLDANGVKSYLADAHINALTDTSFTEKWRAENLTRSATMRARDVHVDGKTALVKIPGIRGFQAYYTSDAVYWREQLSDGATYGRNRGSFNFDHLAQGEQLRMLLLAGKWKSPEASDDGTEFTITAEESDEVAAVKREFEASEIKSFSAEGVVNDRSVIERLVVEMEFISKRDGRLYKVRLRHRVENVGEVSVPTPDWYETATAKAPDVDARITDDQQFLVMEHRGGNPIEPGTNIVLFDRNNHRNLGYSENTQAIEAGTTLYLWMEDDQLRWQRGSRPSDANPQTLDGRYAFWAHRHGFEYFGSVAVSN